MTGLHLVPQKDGRPPEMEPYDFEYQHGYSSVRMPNGSWVCVSHAAPEELRYAMTMAWCDAWDEAC